MISETKIGNSFTKDQSVTEAFYDPSEAVAQRWSVKNVFLEILRNSQVFSSEFYEISKNTFFKERFWWLLLILLE